MTVSTMGKKKGAKVSEIILAALFLIWTAGCFWYFQSNFKYHLFFVEQNQLFLGTADCLSAYFTRPAWLACMAGDWAQQFYHFNFGGPAVLSLSLLVFGVSAFLSLKECVPSRWGIFARLWIPAFAALALMTVEARLFFYENARLASLYALGGGIILWYACHCTTEAFERRRWAGIVIDSLIFVPMAAICFSLFGYGALAFIALELLSSPAGRRIPAGAAISIVLALCFWGRIGTHYRMEKKELALYPGPGRWVDATKARGVEDLLTYNIEYGRGNYNGIIRLYEHSRNAKTPEMSFFYAASASQLGILPDKLMKMKKPNLGTFIHLDSKSNLFTIEMAAELYYLIGDMTYTERACMHANNFSPTKRCASLIKRLAEANLIIGDYAGAQKYLGQLRRSFIYRKWAEDHTPGSFSEDFQREIDHKRQFLNNAGEIRIGDNCHTILTGLLDANRNNIVALDYLLCTDIIANQKAMFMRDYQKYGPRDCELYKKIVK